LKESGRRRARVIVELREEENRPLLDGADHEELVTPIILSHMLSQVALRRELNAIFEELFSSSETEIRFASAGAVGLGGREVTFAEVHRHMSERRTIALGVRTVNGGITQSARIDLNPPRDKRWTFSD